MENDIYLKLCFRYKNKIPIKDDYGFNGILFCNEEIPLMITRMAKFSRSIFCGKEKTTFTGFNPFTGKDSKKVYEIYKFNAIKFIEYANSKRYDWLLLTKEEWDRIKPEKKKIFLKPKQKQL